MKLISQLNNKLTNTKFISARILRATMSFPWLSKARRCLFVMGLLSACSLFGGAFKAEADFTNPVIATVNGENIFSSDVKTQRVLMSIIDPTNQSGALKGKSILDFIIEQDLIVQDSKRFNFTIDTASGAEDMRQLEKAHKWPANYIYSKAERAGVSKQEVDLYFLKQALIQQFIGTLVRGRLQVTDEELNNSYYDILNLNGKLQFLLKEIYIGFNDTTGSQDEDKIKAKQQIYKVYAALKRGANFDTALKRVEDDKNKKEYETECNSGTIGWVQEPQLSQEALAALQEIKGKGFTAPIYNGSGYSIYYLLDKRPVIYFNPDDLQSVNQLKQMLKQKIMAEKSYNIVGNYISELKSNALIKYY